MASLFEQRALRGVPDGGGNELARAKKMATLLLKQDKLSNSGKNTVAGYEQAMALIEPFKFSGNEKQSLDAQNAYASYEVSWADLKQKSSARGQTKGEFENKEREIYFKIPMSNTSSGLKDDPYNVTLRVSEISQDLIELTSLVQEKVDQMNAKGEDASSLEEYLGKLQRRTATMGEFYNDYVEGNFSSGTTRPDVGIFIDSNQDDGGVYNIGIMPVEDLPPGITPGDYMPLKDSAQFDTGYLPVRGKGITVNGVKTFKYGNDVWQDAKDPAGLTKSSGLGVKDGAGGGINLTSAPFAGGDIKPKRFSKVIAGSDDSGAAIWKTFYRDDNNKLFSVDDEMLASLSQDPGYAKDIQNASIIYDTNTARQLAKQEGVEKLSFKPVTAGGEARRAGEIDALRTEIAGREPKGMLDKAVVGLGTAGEAVAGFFSNRKNQPAKPKEPVVSSSAPDMIEQGKTFFRDNLQGFFNRNK